MFHIFHHHVVTHVIIPILVSTAVAAAIGATANQKQGFPHAPAPIGKLPQRTIK